MMHAALQQEMALRLYAALESAGLAIEYPQKDGGKIAGWYAVPPQALIGRLLQLGWRIRFTEDRPADVVQIHRGPQEHTPES